MNPFRGLQAGPSLLASLVLFLFSFGSAWAQSPLARQIAAGGQSVPQSQPLGTDGIQAIEVGDNAGLHRKAGVDVGSTSGSRSCGQGKAAHVHGRV